MRDDIIGGGMKSMDKPRGLLSKILVIGIILLLIGISCVPTNGAYATTSTTLDDNGSLSGYVNDIFGNPIEGALVRVYFHDSYEEDYSDSSGFYHVTNIRICWCMKNTTCSKEGYKTEWVLLSIAENTTYDFALTFDNPPPNRPIIYGPAHGKVGMDYDFTFVIDDFEQRDFYYFIEWGDGTFEEWIGPYPAGLEVTVNHTWYEKGCYLIRCKAKDLWDHETEWSEYMFWIDRSRTSYIDVFHWFLEQFPLLEVLLRIMRLLR